MCVHFDANNDCNIILRQSKHVPLQGSYSSTFSGHTPCSTSILHYRYKQNSILFAQQKVFTILKISSFKLLQLTLDRECLIYCFQSFQQTSKETEAKLMSKGSKDQWIEQQILIHFVCHPFQGLSTAIVIRIQGQQKKPIICQLSSKYQ